MARRRKTPEAQRAIKSRKIRVLAIMSGSITQNRQDSNKCFKMGVTPEPLMKAAVLKDTYRLYLSTSAIREYRKETRDKERAGDLGFTDQKRKSCLQIQLNLGERRRAAVSNHMVRLIKVNCSYLTQIFLRCLATSQAPSQGEAKATNCSHRRQHRI